MFVDLEGVDGLVHKSEINWERSAHPAKWFKVGDEIEVKVISVDKKNERVSLSRKVLLPNPWEKLVEGYKVGDLVEGVVVSVLDFGAFVEIQEGIHGLVHISEIGYANTDDPKAVLKKGDSVLVKIMGINPARERISLSMRRVPISEQMEWIINLENVSEGVLPESDEVEVLQEDSEVKKFIELAEKQAEKPTDQDDQTINDESLEDGQIQKQEAGEQEEETEAESDD